MTAKEKIISLLLELGEAVKAEGGSAMVICTIPKTGIDNNHLIATVQGKKKVLTSAVAKMITDNSPEEICRILVQGFALATLHSIDDKAKQEEKETPKSTLS